MATSCSRNSVHPNKIDKNNLFTKVLKIYDLFKSTRDSSPLKQNKRNKSPKLEKQTNKQLKVFDFPNSC